MAKTNKHSRNLPAKRYTDAEVRKRMTTTLLTLDNPAVILKQLGELLSRMDSGDGIPEDGKGIADETIGRPDRRYLEPIC